MAVIQEPEYIVLSKKKCAELGMDPDRLPSFANVLSPERLAQRRADFDEVLSVVNFFVEKTLDLMKGFPILIVVTDENACVLEMKGDSTIKSTVNQIGICDGLQFEEDVTGTNSISLALRLRHTVPLIGTNHFHRFLHTSACYSVPFQYTDVKQMLGTVSIMTALELHHPALITMLSTLVDSIERELLLRRQNRKLHMLNQVMIDSTRNGIIVTDREGEVISYNDFAQRLTGVRKEDILQKPIGEIDRIGGYMVDLLENGKQVEDVEIIFENEGGPTRKICLFDAVPIYDENARLNGAFAQFRDITESFESREEAVRASQAKSQFLSQMSHELRTPLNAILGFAQLLELNSLTAAQLDDVREIMKAGNHLLELINEILDLSRIENNKIQVTMGEVDVATLMNECLSLVQPLAEAKRVKLLWPSIRHIQVKADRTRLKQAFINILNNAIKYNVDGGTVAVRWSISERVLRLSVADTGYGIPESEQATIFQPFHRLPQHHGIEGTGIGLTITKQLIELMEGRIGVKSELHRGSEFWIELNLTADSMADKAESSFEAAAEPAEEAQPEPHLFHVLYVEDNPANLMLVARIFSGHPHIRLLSAPDATRGIEMARAHRPHLILMDINLPDMSGFEAFGQLQTIEEVKHIPVIAVSANAMPSDLKQGEALGFKTYITKPINVPSFMENIQQVLGLAEEHSPPSSKA